MASKRILSLERRLGVRVLERGRFGATATEAGRLLYPEAQQALTAPRHAAAVLATHTGQAPSPRLASSHTIGGFLLPRGGSTHLGVDDLDLRPRRVGLGRSELETLPISHDEIVAVIVADHRWAGRRTVARPGSSPPRADLAREIGSGTRAVVADALARVGIALTPTPETASTPRLKRAVLDVRLHPPLPDGDRSRTPRADAQPRPRPCRRRRPHASSARGPPPPARRGSAAVRFWRRLRQNAHPGGSSPLGRSAQSVIVLPTVLITNASGNRAAIW